MPCPTCGALDQSDDHTCSTATAAPSTAGRPMPPPPPPPPHESCAPLPPDAIRPERAKDPIVILLIALFLGGISYFVLGQWQKGLVGIAIWICGVVLSILTCGIGSILMIPVVVLLAIDAYSQASLLKNGHVIGQWTFFSHPL